MLPLVFDILVSVLPRAINQEKEIQGIQIIEEKKAMSIHRWYDIKYRKYQRILTKLLELINESVSSRSADTKK